MRYALAFLFVFPIANRTLADDPKVADIDPKGMPSGFKPGQPTRYAIWYDNDDWHIRVTTSSAFAKFTGTIEPVDGKIVSMKLISGNASGKKGADLPPLKTESKSINLSNEINKGSLNGYDFKLDDSATAIKFDLRVNDKESPELIFVGAKGAHPKSAVVILPAKPGKKGK